jgi:hypothetical protein
MKQRNRDSASYGKTETDFFSPRAYTRAKTLFQRFTVSQPTFSLGYAKQRAKQGETDPGKIRSSWLRLDDIKAEHAQRYPCGARFAAVIEVQWITRLCCPRQGPKRGMLGQRVTLGTL